MTQWLRVRLPMQGTQVRALVWEDPTFHGATKPVCHNYWACTLEPASHNYWALTPQLLKPACLEPMLCNKRSHRTEKPAYHNEDPMQPKKKDSSSLSSGFLSGNVTHHMCTCHLARFVLPWGSGCCKDANTPATAVVESNTQSFVLSQVSSVLTQHSQNYLIS